MIPSRIQTHSHFKQQLPNNGSVADIVIVATDEELKRFRHNNHGCEQIQFPLVVAYAIKIHKCQGITLKKAVLNIEKDFRPGLGY